jgi:S-adenosylmethionine:tRNA ribosyltransferase-isomerase
LIPRVSSKLLLYKNNEVNENVFNRIADYLPQHSLLVYNNTRVIQARLIFEKNTGAHIEVFCLEPNDPADYALSLGATNCCVWKCMIGNLKKWKAGQLSKVLDLKGSKCTFHAERFSSDGNTHLVQFCWDNADIHFADILENAGELPIPPYLHRKTEPQDLETYQTIYSKVKGSVAAPTAGLHFTDRVFESFKSKDIEIDEVTLHVGAGTFQPVKTRDIAEHTMHTEVISVKRDTVANILKNLGNIIAVGTTSVRTLESLYYIGCNFQYLTDDNLHYLTDDNLHSIRVDQWTPYNKIHLLTAHQALQNILDYLDLHQFQTLHAETQIMIRPGYEFRIINGMITNFHQPRSTLLLLVSAFVDGNWKMIYDYALKNDFRFLSYGDSSLLLR